MFKSLNQQFAIPGQILFQEGKGELAKAVITNKLASAEIYLHGAHVTSFVPVNGAEILWLSELARFEDGKAIRGGIPVIWPWFGAHSTDPAKPQHGFARTHHWQVLETRVLADGATQLCLSLEDDENTRSLWPYAFALELKVTVAEKLHVELVCENTGKQAFQAGAALHSYFLIGDIEKTCIRGLEGREYIDQLQDNRIQPQPDPVTFHNEVDRIYVNTDDDCIIDDPVLQRQIVVSKSGSLSTVVWNPWDNKAGKMKDFPDQGYRNMLCIESANAGPDVRRLEPGDVHRLKQIISA